MSLSLAELNKLVDGIRALAWDGPIFYASPETTKRIRHIVRLGNLDHAHPLPRRKLRKCHMRKLHAARKCGRAHIERVEQVEAIREKALMKRIQEKSNGNN